MLRLHLPKKSFQARGTSPDGRWRASATHNRISVPIRGQSIESSRRVCCGFVPGPFEFFYVPSSQDFPLSCLHRQLLSSPHQPRNPGLFNTFPPHSNDTQKVIDTQCTFVVLFHLCSQCQIQARRAATLPPSLHSSLPLGFHESPVTNHEPLSLLESTLTKVYQNKGL